MESEGSAFVRVANLHRARRIVKRCRSCGRSLATVDLVRQILRMKLLYVADPMCSWCWGFHSVLEQVRDAFRGGHIQYVMGGLARDSDDPMPEETQAFVQDQWRKVTEMTGAEFNWGILGHVQAAPVDLPGVPRRDRCVSAG